MTLLCLVATLDPTAAQGSVAEQPSIHRIKALEAELASEVLSGFGTASVGADRPRSHENGSGLRPLTRTGSSSAANQALVGTSLGLTKVIKVWCDLGESINTALQNPADELEILVRGICVENVEIRRDRVSLIGEDPATDGIRPIDNGDPRQSALHIREARRVHVENLSLGGGDWDGLRVSGSTDGITVVNTRLENNGVRGATLLDSLARFTDVVATGNGAGDGGGRGGLLVVGSSKLICERCTITDNPVEEGVEFGVIALQGAVAYLKGSTVTGRVGLIASDRTTITMVGGFLSGTSESADVAWHSSLNLYELSYEGAIFVYGHSTADLYGAKQSDSVWDNWVVRNSSINMAPTRFDGVDFPAFLVRPLRIGEFSNAIINAGAEVTDLACSDVSDAVCRPGAVVAQSTCGSCPVP